MRWVRLGGFGKVLLKFLIGFAAVAATLWPMLMQSPGPPSILLTKARAEMGRWPRDFGDLAGTEVRDSFGHHQFGSYNPFNTKWHTFHLVFSTPREAEYELKGTNMMTFLPYRVRIHLRAPSEKNGVK